MKWQALVATLAILFLCGSTVYGADIFVGPGQAYLTIQAAIDDASSGDVIHVAAGTYAEDLTIATANLELVGAGAATTKVKGVAFSPWASWPLPDPNVDIQADGVRIHDFTFESPAVPDGFYASGMVLTGTGIQIHDNAFVSLGDGNGGCVALQTYRDDAPGYDSDISDLLVYDNSFSGTPGGSYYGILIHHTTVGNGDVGILNNNLSGKVLQGIIIERDNCVIQHNTLGTFVAANSRGLWVADLDGRDQTQVVLQRNEVSGFQYGARIGLPAQVLSEITLTDNILHGNLTGLQVQSSADAVTLERNDIRDNQTMGAENTDTAHDLDATGNWWGSATGPSHASSNPTGEGNSVSDFVLFEPWLAPADVTVDPAVSGPLGVGVMQTVNFHFKPNTSAQATTPALYGYELTIAIAGLITFEVSDVLDLGGLGDLGNHFFIVTDNGDFTITVSDILLGGGPGLQVEDDLFSITFTTAFIFPPGDGTIIIVDHTLRDEDNHEIFASTAGGTIIVDYIPPTPAAEVTASPGHGKVEVAWQASPSADVAQYEIWRARWHDGTGASVYPEYDDAPGHVIPPRPDDYPAVVSDPFWELAGTVEAPDVTFTDTGDTTRGVYYYEVFAVDAVGNVSQEPVGLDRARATNYWLGDVTVDLIANPGGDYDGLVDNNDIDFLGSTFGTSQGDAQFWRQADIGPTDDHSRKGIPETDDTIDFEDLLIFALSYGMVTPAKAPPVGSRELLISWQPVEAGTWALRVEEPCANLKALRLRAGVPAGQAIALSAGDLLGEQDAPIFLRNIDSHGLDVSVAAMGPSALIVGAGELFRVRLPEGIEPRSPSIQARGLQNEEIAHGLTSAPESLLPPAFVLQQNYPNPFNPATVIRFGLPHDQHVRLSVCSVDGRRIRTLLDETRPAGHHEVIWDGRDGRGRPVASGAYFYRIEAGSYRQTRKMILMK